MLYAIYAMLSLLEQSVGFLGLWVFLFVYWCFLHLNRTENSITFKPYFFAHATHIHTAMILVMMFAKCSIDLMNIAISGKENNMKGKYNPHHGVSIFNYLSGECIFTCLSKQFWPPMMSEQSVWMCLTCWHPCHGLIWLYSSFRSFWLF